jgi:transposase
MLVNAARGLTKSYGERLPSSGTGQVRGELAGSLSEPLQNALKPLRTEVESVSERIREYDAQIESMAMSRYPETELLKQVHGVGALTALTFVLTVEDPHRFRRSRDAGAYFGLQTRQICGPQIAPSRYGLQKKCEWKRGDEARTFESGSRG